MASIERYFQLMGNSGDLVKVNYQEEILSKGALRGYQGMNKYDVVVLVHRCEGRVLLTDRNGFYTDLLAYQFLATVGNVLIVLIQTRNPEIISDLVNKDIDTMASIGDQPTLKLYKQ